MSLLEPSFSYLIAPGLLQVVFSDIHGPHCQSHDLTPGPWQSERMFDRVVIQERVFATVASSRDPRQRIWNQL